jgi:NAD(P)-dependent dehydrogenase (short-subunit alcohol dehydrogenase family)
MTDMKEKVGLVTGGGSGIGRATALELAARGAAVMVADFDLEGAEETVRMLADAGGRGHAAKVDVADAASVKAAVEATSEAFGRLDYLVNSAGISAAGAPAALHDVELSAFERVLDVNVVGTFLMMKHAIPAMLASDGGAVVNLSSTMGERAAAGDPSYATSKHAVRGLTQSAALTYAERGVRVNSIGPGVIKTQMTAPIFEQEEISSWLLGVTPMRRFGEPREVAKLIAFLCSDDASYMTGAYVPVDGGWLAG